MFQEGPIEGLLVRPLRQFRDARGWLVEMFRHDELEPDRFPVMAYLSQTLPGVVRGPHAHREQADLFAFVGPGDFKLYLWDSRRDRATFGNRQTLLVGESNMQSVFVPAGVVHAYKNVSPMPGLVFNSPDQLYAGEGKKGPVDEIRYEDQADSPYVMD